MTRRHKRASRKQREQERIQGYERLIRDDWAPPEDQPYRRYMKPARNWDGHLLANE